jgi:hypothetical protein
MVGDSPTEKMPRVQRGLNDESFSLLTHSPGGSRGQPQSFQAFLLMTVAVVASLLPAARAARVDVMEALRSE